MAAYVITLHSFGGSMGEAAQPIHAVCVQATLEQANQMADAIYNEIDDEEILVAVTVMDDSKPTVSMQETVDQFKATYEEMYGD